jgi:hypothetical protein
MVGRSHLQSSWAVHSRERGRNNADHPPADANNDHCASYDRPNRDDGAHSDLRANDDRAVTDVDNVPPGSEWIVA